MLFSNGRRATIRMLQHLQVAIANSGRDSLISETGMPNTLTPADDDVLGILFVHRYAEQMSCITSDRRALKLVTIMLRSHPH